MIAELLGDLADRRVELGLSQHAVARLAHINPAMMSHIERGRRVPSLRVLARVCAALDLQLAFQPAADTAPSAATLRPVGGRLEPPTDHPGVAL